MSGSTSSANRFSPGSTNVSIEALARAIEAGLRRHRDPVRAVAEKAYLKSDLAFMGCGLPAMRQLVRSTTRGRAIQHAQLTAVVRLLWRERVFEQRMVAILLLATFEPLLGGSDVPLLERLLRESKTWAFVDELAISVMGRLVERRPALRTVLDRWSRDDDFWIRRSALLALLPPLRRGQGDFPRFVRYAEGMLDEREFFVRKAIGWILRETGKRRPDLVYHWLVPRAGRASGITVREAVKYLSPTQRAEVLEVFQSAKNRTASSRRGPR